MSKKRFLLGVIRNILLCAALLAVFFAAFSIIQVVTEYSYQYKDAAYKLMGLEERQTKNISQINAKVSTYMEHRESAFSLLALLLDEGGQIDLETYQSLAGFTVLCVTDARYRVLEGASIGEYCPDYAARLAAMKPEGIDVAGFLFVSDADGESYLLLARWLSDGRVLAGLVQTGEISKEASDTFQRMASLKQYTFGEHGFMIGYYPETAKALYLPDALPEGCDEKTLLDRAADGDGFALLGKQVYQVITYDFADGTRYAAFIALSDIWASSAKTTFLYALAFTWGAMLLYWYARFLQEDEARGILLCKVKQTVFGLHINSVALRRMGRTALSVFIALAAISYYLETFTSASGQRISNAQRLSLLEQTLQDRTQEVQNDTLEYDSDLVVLARLTALALEAQPSLCSEEGMTRIADALGVDCVYVFDAAGKTVATNTVFKDFALSTDPADQSFAFFDVVRGYNEVCIQDTKADETAWHREILYVGVTRRDVQGMVQLGVVPDDYKRSLSMPLLSVMTEMPAMGDGAFFFMVDEEGLVQGWPSEAYNGDSADRLGLTEAELKDGYSGYQWLAGRQYFLSCRKIGEDYAFLVIPKSSVYGDDILVMQFSVIVGFALMALLALLMLVKRAAVRLLLRGKQQRREPDAYPSSPTGLAGLYGRFWRKNAGEKLETILRLLVLLSVASAFVYYEWMDSRQEANSMLAYVLSRKWERSVNVFSLTYVAWVLSTVYVVAYILCKVIRWFMSAMSTRTRTIGVLVSNVLRYGAAFGALFYCMPFVGFNPAAIVATASFISFALTFGAQELIKDFLSGMFIIFEDSLRVGDRVIIGGSEGYVEEIGLRMTTLVLDGGRAEVIHNSAVNRFTRKLHLAQVRVELADAADVDAARRVLLEELYRFGSSLTHVIAEPYLERKEESEGVILVCAQCRKEDVETIEYELSGMVRRALERSGVNAFRMKEKQE